MKTCVLQREDTVLVIKLQPENLKAKDSSLYKTSHSQKEKGVLGSYLERKSRSAERRERTRD